MKFPAIFFSTKYKTKAFHNFDFKLIDVVYLQNKILTSHHEKLRNMQIWSDGCCTVICIYHVIKLRTNAF